ncbi:MAG: glucokinase, partial [Pseudomonadota bacterium]
MRLARVQLATRAVHDVTVLRASEHADMLDALATFVDATGGLEGCRSAAIAAAGPVIDGNVDFTNSEWSLSAADVSAMLGGVPVALVNDLQGVAAALPHLTRDDRCEVVQVDVSTRSSRASPT